jgi:hypothetical protein
MNKHAVPTLGTLPVPPPDHRRDDFVSKVVELYRFFSKVAKLCRMLVSGQRSYEFVLSMLDSIITTKDFPVWKTLVMREKFRAAFTYSDTHARLIEYYRRPLSEGGYRVCGPIRLLADDDSVACRFFKEAFKVGKNEVDLVRVSPRSLGFADPKGVKRNAFYARALHFGLEKCWYEVGFALRLAYQDQPCGEWLTIATDTNDLETPSRILRVGRGRRDDPLCIVSSVSFADTLVPIDDEYIFVKPRK